MKYRIAGLAIAVSILTASCTSGPALRQESVKQCSDSPRNAISIFLQGIKELSLSLLNAVTHEEDSLYGIFGNRDESRGKEVVRQIAANPEVSGANGSCACSFLSIADTDNPNAKIVWVKRIVTADDDSVHNYKRSFRVRFEPHSHCILSVEPIESKWERA